MLRFLRFLVRFFTSKLTYVIIFLLLGCVFLYTSYIGNDNRVSVIELIEKENPARTEQLRQLLNRYTPEAQMLGFEYYRKNYPDNALTHYCNDLASNKDSVLACLRMIEMVKSCEGEISDEQLKYLDTMAGQAVKLSAYSTIPSRIERERSEVALSCLANYTDILAHAVNAGGKSRELVLGNSISALMYNILCMDKTTASESDWVLYCAEHEWMSDMMMLLMVTPPSDVVVSSLVDNEELSAAEYLKSAVELCGKYPSMIGLARDIVNEWQQAVKHNQVADIHGNTEAELIARKLPLLYEVYRRYGPEADTIIHKTKISVDELLNFLLLNEKELGEMESADFIHVACSILSSGCKNLAYYAHMQPHFMSLYVAVGADTIQEVLSKGAPEGCLYLLSAACSDEDANLNAEAAKNAMAYAKIDPGHAFQLLNNFGHDPRFKDIIAKDNRMMMYLDRFPENFEALTRDEWRGYVDKEITDDGRWKNSWTDYVPCVGALLKVGQNWACGYPCTWGELGWAAWEAGEGIAIVVASLPTGGSGGMAVKLASTSLKTTLKNAAKAVSKSSAKMVARTSVKQCVSSFFKKTIVHKGISIASKGLRMGKVMLKRQLPKALKNYAELAGKTIKGMTNVRMLYRALAVGMVLREICERTLPNADKIAAAIGERVGEIIVATQKVPQEILTGIAEEIAKSNSRSGAFVIGVILLAVALLLIFFKPLKKQFNKRFA